MPSSQILEIPARAEFDFVNDLITSGDLFNNDTGSVRGTDAGLGNTPINAQDSVPDATGAPTSNYKYMRMIIQTQSLLRMVRLQNFQHNWNLKFWWIKYL